MNNDTTDGGGDKHTNGPNGDNVNTWNDAEEDDYDDGNQVGDDRNNDDLAVTMSMKIATTRDAKQRNE